MHNQNNIDHLLTAVNKPSRYIDHELNSFHKKPQTNMINFCLAFPDIYEIGFSHLGLKLLYHILNKETDATCDRVYAPDKDLADLLAKHKIPLFSLENKVSLKEFDIIGFTLQSELTYTNILYMLDNAEIPLFSKDRTDQYPIIIAGGPGSVNPLPIADFFDAIFIGEGEEAIVEIKNIVKQCKDSNLNKIDVLKKLSSIKGLYVPFIMDKNDVCLVKDQKVNAHNTYHTVVSRKYDKFSEGIRYNNQLISWQQTTHDRYIYEIMRGCSRGCRFCLAGYLYRPVREREPSTILRQLTEEVVKYGWEETALLSLSSADYTCIKPLIKEIVSQLKNYKTDISLPSMRVDSLDDDIIKLLNNSGQTSITIAPEAGSQRLRDIINKDITEDQILYLVDIALKNRWKNIKLYFMIGLPFERDEDIEEIVLLVKKIALKSRKRIKLSITLSPFIPKPHTPFQWANMLSTHELQERINYIKNQLAKFKFIKIKYHSLGGSLLECVLTRGDRKISKLIFGAYQNGAVFDGWDEFFNLQYWQAAAIDNHIDLQEYTQEIDIDDALPWELVSLGVSKDFLMEEYLKAKKEILSKDCRIMCHNCGLCSSYNLSHTYAVTENIHDQESMSQLSDSSGITVSKELPANDSSLFTEQIPSTYKYRIYYSKKGLLKFVTHLDMLRMMHRILRRTGLPLKYTEGFNRHPKIDFCPPLSVGVEGLNEIMDIMLEYPNEVKEIMAALEEIKINDLEWNDVIECDFEFVPPIKNFHYESVLIIAPIEYKGVFVEQVKAYENSNSWEATKTKKGIDKLVDLKPIIVKMNLLEDYEKKENTIALRVVKQIVGASVFDILNSVFDIDRSLTGRLLIMRENLLIDV